MKETSIVYSTFGTDDMPVKFIHVAKNMHLLLTPNSGH